MSRAMPQFAGKDLMLSTRGLKSIHALADDIILIIVSFLSVRDILALRQVSLKSSFSMAIHDMVTPYS